MTESGFLDHIKELWHVGVGILVALAGYLELRFGVKQNAKDHALHVISQEKKDVIMWTKIDSLQGTLTSILQALGKIEGKLERRD